MFLISSYKSTLITVSSSSIFLFINLLFWHKFSKIMLSLFLISSMHRTISLIFNWFKEEVLFSWGSISLLGPPCQKIWNEFLSLFFHWTFSRRPHVDSYQWHLWFWQLSPQCFNNGLSEEYICCSSPQGRSQPSTRAYPKPP